MEKALSNESQHMVNGGSSSTPPPPLASEITSLEESSFKVGKLSAEERKERIHRYMKKRNQRNFSKKIKVLNSLFNYSLFSYIYIYGENAKVIDFFVQTDVSPLKYTGGAAYLMYCLLFFFFFFLSNWCHNYLYKKFIY